MDALYGISKALTEVPLPKFESIGYYYKALCLKREGQIEQARVLFEKVIEEGHLSYRARAMQSLGVTYFDDGDLDSARRLFIEARYLSCRNEYSNPLALIQSQWAFGILQSLDGDHNSSLANFESLRPMVEVIASRHPFLWFDYQNSLAVELMEVGRMEEAARACRIALASPFARFYPEWHETAKDIARKTRRASSSVVSLRLPTHGDSKPLRSGQPGAGQLRVEVKNNIIRLQDVARSKPASPQARPPARIIAFPERINSLSSEEILNDPAYIEKRYEIMVTAAETRDCKLLDEMYAILLRRKKITRPSPPENH